MAAAILMAAAMFRAKAQEPRLAVVNAKIITMSESNPAAEAMVSEGERIIYVGELGAGSKNLRV